MKTNQPNEEFNDNREPDELNPKVIKILNILSVVLLLLLVLLLLWPSIYWPKKIQVLDVETNQPIADAIAIYKYAISSRGMDFLFGWIPIGHGGNSYYNCIKSIITKTDANGYFKIPFRITFFGKYTVPTYIYKQGYKDGEHWAGYGKNLENTIYLSKDNRSSSEKIRDMEYIFQGPVCREGDKLNKELDRLNLQEMKKIAETHEDFNKD